MVQKGLLAESPLGGWGSAENFALFLLLKTSIIAAIKNLYNYH